MEGYGWHVQPGFPFWAIPSRATAATGSPHMITAARRHHHDRKSGREKAGKIEKNKKKAKHNKNKRGKQIITA
jgi:hypothetical protein